MAGITEFPVAGTHKVSPITESFRLSCPEVCLIPSNHFMIWCLLNHKPTFFFFFTFLDLNTERLEVPGFVLSTLPALFPFFKEM